MRKYVLQLVFCLCSLTMSAQFPYPEIEPIPLNLYSDHGGSISTGRPKAPIEFPLVGVYDHTIFFNGCHTPFIIEIYDTLNILVFFIYVDGETTQVPIPNSIVGTYEIHLCTESYYFQGVISL